jgi:hypothetical protein
MNMGGNKTMARLSPHPAPAINSGPWSVTLDNTGVGTFLISGNNLSNINPIVDVTDPLGT